MVIINKDLLPNEVTVTDFKNWKTRFLDFRRNEIEIFWSKDHESSVEFPLELEISPDTPVSEYGLYSPEEIKKMIKNIIKKNVSNSSKIIKELDEVDELNENTLMSVYDNGNNSSEFEILLNKIRNILNKKKFTELVLGEFRICNEDYDNREYKIILYVNNIIESYPDKIKEGFEQTFIHELFHFYHSVCSFGGTNIEEFFYRKDYPSKVIKESLARFFELSYMKNYYPSFNYNDCMSNLKDYSVSVYPYSGAAYIKNGYDFFKKITYNAFKEFAKIYNMKFNDALYYILNNGFYSQDYYDVLNHDYEYNHRSVIKLTSFKMSKLKPQSSKDYSKYEFEGIKDLTKGRLVLEVVKKYCSNNNPSSYKELEQVFPANLRGSKNGKGVIALENTISDKDKGIGPNSIKRYFTDDPIKLSSGEVILVCSQWGKGNIDIFIEAATKKLGFNIKQQPKINNDLLKFITSNEKLDLNTYDKKTNNFNNFNINFHDFITVDIDVTSEKFLDMLDRIIEQKGYNTYKLKEETGIDRKSMSRIKNAEVQPSKKNVIKMCIGLKLDLKTGIELLRKAGYSLNDEYLDRLVYKCLKDNIYDKDEIDDTLEASNKKPLFRKSYDE